MNYTKGCATALLAALVGCGASADTAEQVSLATFNVGLAFGYVPEASARVAPIIEALAASDHDVVCLQEL